ncbi:recombinase family protein [Ruegeria sp. HKCCD4884]|uniref:recombinase family protein n=1 Tax=Ruegeria sp. HKCCD4884 TaxID=2683022 RepID=UPI001491FA2A|nr:recombinase family protein [Ruegeria sp. HKCCD4884]NOD93855.1 recombinase family protein [Ruegeria sp. HKCCD4884]
MNNQSTERKKAVIYCRVSSKKQETDGSGLSGQEASCRDYAEKNGYEVVEVFHDVISGKHFDRPGMQSLIEFLQSRDANEFVVIVDDGSRLARGILAHTRLRARISSLGAILVSPKQSFGDKAADRLQENVVAVVSGYERENIVERAHSRSLERLRAGYWIFHAPNGYKYEKSPLGGKVLVRNEPVASILSEALNGFAEGRFQSPMEVLRFLEGKPQYLEGLRARALRIDSVTKMLRNVHYAGYLEYPNWAIPLTKAQHPSLITYDTYLIIQDRLQGRSVAPARKDIDKEFPLRGFLVCEACGRRITSCWSQSRTGRKYPYYLCQYRKCAEKGLSTPRAKVENEFEQLLKSVVPDLETFQIAEQMFRDAWVQRNRANQSELASLRAQSREIEKKVRKNLDRAVRSEEEETAQAYENHALLLRKEQAAIDAEIEKMAVPALDYDSMFELSMRFLSNPYEIWKKGSISLKRTVLRLVFSQPLVFSRSEGVRTPDTTFPFKALRFLSATENGLVPESGLARA